VEDERARHDVEAAIGMREVLGGSLLERDFESCARRLPASPLDHGRRPFDSVHDACGAGAALCRDGEAAGGGADIEDGLAGVHARKVQHPLA
jgi:hypothetical protein